MQIKYKDETWIDTQPLQRKSAQTNTSCPKYACGHVKNKCDDLISKLTTLIYIDYIVL